MMAIPLREDAGTSREAKPRKRKKYRAGFTQNAAAKTERLSLTV